MINKNKINNKKKQTIIKVIIKSNIHSNNLLKIALFKVNKKKHNLNIIKIFNLFKLEKILVPKDYSFKDP